MREREYNNQKRTSAVDVKGEHVERRKKKYENPKTKNPLPPSGETTMVRFKQRYIVVRIAFALAAHVDRHQVLSKDAVRVRCPVGEGERRSTERSATQERHGTQQERGSTNEGRCAGPGALRSRHCRFDLIFFSCL